MHSGLKRLALAFWLVLMSSAAIAQPTPEAESVPNGSAETWREVRQQPRTSAEPLPLPPMVRNLAISPWPTDGILQPIPEGLVEFDPEDAVWLWQLQLIAGTSLSEDGFDEAVRGRGYGSSTANFGGDTAVLRRLGRFWHLGVRLGARARQLRHYSQPAATVWGTDLLLLLDLRYPMRSGSLGVEIAAGGALVMTALNGQSDTHGAGRLSGSVGGTLRLAGSLHLSIRVGWDYFQTSGPHDVDLGGFRAALGLEVLE